jgi:hypothetical protein
VSAVIDQLLGAGVPRAAIAWEARGLWSDASLVQAAARFGVTPVVDARDAKPAEMIYARLLRLGVGARTNTRLTEKLALAFLQSGEAYLAVDGGSALALKREFEELIEELADGDDDLDEDLDAADGEQDSTNGAGQHPDSDEAREADDEEWEGDDGSDWDDDSDDDDSDDDDSDDDKAAK